MDWMISANSKLYNHKKAFEYYSHIDWRQGNYKVSIGDIIYIYSTKPIKKLQYKCVIDCINLEFDEISDDKRFWNNQDEYLKSQSGLYMRLRMLQYVDDERLSLINMQKNGLKVAPQGSKKLNGKLLDYIENVFDENKLYRLPHIVSEDENLYEGAVVRVNVNRYERNIYARNKCIEHYGAVCKVCGFDFEKQYGEVGKNFIEVHHTIPLSTINYEYKINYITDLVPVCSNCHSMLHRKVDGKELSVKDLQSRLRKVY